MGLLPPTFRKERLSEKMSIAVSVAGVSALLNYIVPVHMITSNSHACNIHFGASRIILFQTTYNFSSSDEIETLAVENLSV